MELQSRIRAKAEKKAASSDMGLVVSLEYCWEFAFKLSHAQEFYFAPSKKPRPRCLNTNPNNTGCRFQIKYFTAYKTQIFLHLTTLLVASIKICSMKQFHKKPTL